MLSNMFQWTFAKLMSMSFFIAGLRIWVGTKGREGEMKVWSLRNIAFILPLCMLPCRLPPHWLWLRVGLAQKRAKFKWMGCSLSCISWVGWCHHQMNQTTLILWCCSLVCEAFKAMLVVHGDNETFFRH